MAMLDKRGIPSDFAPQQKEFCLRFGIAMTMRWVALALAGRNFRKALLTTLELIGFFAALSLPSLDAAEQVNQSVVVEIIENIPDQTDWRFDPPTPSESYTETFFGFSSMPTRYSKKGVKVDRSMPFLFRASATVTLPPGDCTMLLRARTGSRLFQDGRLLLETKFPNLNADGHEEVPVVPLPLAPNIRYLQPGHFEVITNLISNGQPHRYTLEAIIGSKGRRPELGELSVSVAFGEKPFQLLTPDPAKVVALTDEGWVPYARERASFWKTQDGRSRRSFSAEELGYWKGRHELARKQISALPPLPVPSLKTDLPTSNEIDRFIGVRLEEAKVLPAPPIDDWAFLRRVTLDTVGAIPTRQQIEAFDHDSAATRRSLAIERLLNDPGWADHWVSYWQDVLAENPGIVKPMLNNTGPFRWWIHESLLDNKPFDRMVTELVMMDGSAYYGGPAGFGLASENDVPMAAKAQIVAQAFLGMQMQCARCHDAPYHHFKQKDLFSLAAMLKKGPQQVPLSSSIPTNSNIIIGRVVNVTLRPGSNVDPAWPFPELVSGDLPEGTLRDPSDTRERLAALLTDPRNERFAQVLVNRIWKRFFGWGLVEPVDDWETAKPSHPELLAWLGREFVSHDYDLKHIARLILNSQTYQRAVRSDDVAAAKAETRLFAGPARRRLSAEQMVDSLFLAVGKQFDAEEMNMDVDGRRPVKDFNNLGTPCRAWQFASLSNERDRPALSMPRAQQIVDTMTTFGWREARQSPQTVRDDAPNVLQPASMANGIMANGRIARLSDDSTITALALEAKSLPELIDAVVMQLLSRPPTTQEKQMLLAHLTKGFNERRTEPSAGFTRRKAAQRPVSWSNHLNPEATRIKQELEKEVRGGDIPTDRLRADWRERMEDVVWVLINSPEFVFVP